MSWLTLPRKSEPEMASEAEEVNAHASPAVAHLDAGDNMLVDQIVWLGLGRGWRLDIRRGPPGIPRKIACLAFNFP